MAEQPNVTERASEMAKMIWQAGLGAYGKALDDVVDQVDKVSKETSKFFDELVEKGKALEDQTQKRISGVRRRSTMSIDERIAKVRQSLGFDSSRDVKLDALLDKLNRIAKSLDRLIDTMGREGAASAAKRAARKSSQSPSVATAAFPARHSLPHWPKASPPPVRTSSTLAACRRRSHILPPMNWARRAACPSPAATIRPTTTDSRWCLTARRCMAE